MTLDPKDITVEWRDKARITADGLVERWDAERQEWVRDRPVREDERPD